MIKLEPSQNDIKLEPSINMFRIEPSINKVIIELIAIKEDSFFVSPYQIVVEQTEV